MEKLKLKFVWGAAERIKGEWHLGLWGWYDRLPGFRHSGLAISVRGLLIWAAGLAAALYLSAATALYFHFRQNPFNQVTLTDTILLPVRWDHVREVRGRMMIEEGLADLKQKRWPEAAMKLRLGLTRAPHEWRARLALGQFYVMANQRANALKVLTEDFPYGYPGRKYLETLFALATEGEDYDLVVTTCDRFESEPADRSWRELQRNIALLRAQRGEEVLQALAKAGRPALEGDREAKVTALVELGRPADALVELAQWEQLPRYDRALVLKLKIRALRDAGRLPEMVAATQAYRAERPADPRALAYVIAQRWLAGQQAEALAQLEEFFRRFSADASNVILMTKAAGDAKSAVLVARCAQEAAAHGFSGKLFKFALAQAQLACGEWAGAARSVAQLKASNAVPDPGEAFLEEWLGRLLAVVVTPDEAPQAGLIALLQERPITLRIYRQSCEVLLQAKRLGAARQLLDLGIRAYPTSRTLVKLREQADAQLKAETIPVAPVTPPRPVANAKAERDFFSELEAAEKEQRWADAAQAIREARATKPRWLAGREPEVLEAQMRVAARLDDVLDLLGAARLLLDGSAARSERLLTLARDWAGAGDKQNAARLLQEVLRRSPTYPPALRLKAEWAPKPAPETPPAPAPKVTGPASASRPVE